MNDESEKGPVDGEAEVGVEKTQSEKSKGDKTKTKAKSGTSESHRGHGCRLDPEMYGEGAPKDGDGGEEGEESGLGEALDAILAGYIGYIGGSSRKTVHCYNPATGQMVTLHGTNDEINQTLHEINEQNAYDEKFEKVVRVAKAAALVGGLAAIGTLAVIGVSRLFARKS